MKIINLQGKKFGRLTVIRQTGVDQRGEKIWHCRCECGKESDVLSSNLRSGHTLSCGCYRDEQAKEANIKHGLARTKIYTIWIAIKRRCYSKKCADYPDYGGRGIQVCDEWKNDFISFYKWAVSSGYSEGLSIDRIDNDGNYEPNNCRWATLTEQANNKRNNCYITYRGQTRTKKQWSKILGINYYTLNSRLRKGWSIEDALSRKVGRRYEAGRGEEENRSETVENGTRSEEDLPEVG